MIQTAFAFIVIISSPLSVTSFSDVDSACRFTDGGAGRKLFAQYTPSLGLCDNSGCSQFTWRESYCKEAPPITPLYVEPKNP